MGNLPQISEAEYEVMKIVWDHAPVSTNEVVERLVKVKDWSPKTIQTMLLRLVKKKVLTYHKESRVFVYEPLVKKEDYISGESSIFLKKFYGGNLRSMVLNFVEQDRLSEEDIEELKEILENRRKR